MFELMFVEDLPENNEHVLGTYSSFQEVEEAVIADMTPQHTEFALLVLESEGRLTGEGQLGWETHKSQEGEETWTCDYFPSLFRGGVSAFYRVRKTGVLSADADGKCGH